MTLPTNTASEDENAPFKLGKSQKQAKAVCDKNNKKQNVQIVTKRFLIIALRCCHYQKEDAQRLR
jgi:hypothetical protein